MNKRIFASILAVMVMAGSALAINESEPNDARIQANAFTIGDTLTGGLPGGFGGDSSGDPIVDYWSFSATNGTSYTFFASSNGSGIAPLDLALDIENSGGTILDSVDDTGNNQSETLTWVAPSTATFYLVVWKATTGQNAISTYNVTTGVSNVEDWQLY